MTVGVLVIVSLESIKGWYRINIGMLQTIYLFHYEKLGTLNYFNWVGGGAGREVKGGGIVRGEGAGWEGEKARERGRGGGGWGWHTYPSNARPVCTAGALPILCLTTEAPTAPLWFLYCLITIQNQ